MFLKLPSTHSCSVEPRDSHHNARSRRAMAGPSSLGRPCLARPSWESLSPSIFLHRSVFPISVAPKCIQSQQGFVTCLRPELSAAFHPTLKLPAGRFDCSGTDGFVELVALDVLHSLRMARCRAHPRRIAGSRRWKRNRRTRPSSVPHRSEVIPRMSCRRPCP